MVYILGENDKLKLFFFLLIIYLKVNILLSKKISEKREVLIISKNFLELIENLNSMTFFVMAIISTFYK